MLTDRDMRVVMAVAVYGLLNRPQIQRLCFGGDKTGRSTRRRLDILVKGGYIRRHNAQVIYPNSSPAGSVYFMSFKGCELLAEFTGDGRFLLCSTAPPIGHHILHQLAVSDAHIALNQAIGTQTEVELLQWVNEGEVINQDEKEATKHKKLFTTLSDNPKLVCAPDAAFVLKSVGGTKVFYVEMDRATSGAHQVSCRKTKGFHELGVRRLHQQQFPAATAATFTVLCIAPNTRRREALRRNFHDKPGRELWKFACMEDLTQATWLFQPVWHPTDGAAVPLVRLQAADAAADDGAVNRKMNAKTKQPTETPT